MNHYRYRAPWAPSTEASFTLAASEAQVATESRPSTLAPNWRGRERTAFELTLMNPDLDQRHSRPMSHCSALSGFVRHCPPRPLQARDDAPCWGRLYPGRTYWQVLLGKFATFNPGTRRDAAKEQSILSCHMRLLSVPRVRRGRYCQAVFPLVIHPDMTVVAALVDTRLIEVRLAAIPAPRPPLHWLHLAI